MFCPFKKFENHCFRTTFGSNRSLLHLSNFKGCFKDTYKGLDVSVLLVLRSSLQGDIIFVTGGSSCNNSTDRSSQLEASKKLMSSKIFQLRPFLYFDEI